MTYLDTREINTDDYEAADIIDLASAICGTAEDASVEDALADLDYLSETMIPETDFEDYARDLADDLGITPRDYTWPTSCIDWTQAADELSQDYTSVTFNGTDYYVRL